MARKRYDPMREKMEALKKKAKAKKEREAKEKAELKKMAFRMKRIKTDSAAIIHALGLDIKRLKRPSKVITEMRKALKDLQQQRRILARSRTIAVAEDYRRKRISQMDKMAICMDENIRAMVRIENVGRDQLKSLTKEYRKLKEKGKAIMRKGKAPWS